MNTNPSKRAGSIFIALVMVFTILGMSTSPARAGASDSAIATLNALSTSIATITRVSVDSSGAQANSWSDSPSLSADGRYVAFASDASNLVSGDTNGAYDVFLRDTQTGSTTRISVASDGTQGDSGSFSPSISADGRFVAFESVASNLVYGDTNGVVEVFLHDTLTGTTTRISVDSSGTQGNNYSNQPAISADGRYVAFSSNASNLVIEDTNNNNDIFLRDTQTGITTRLSIDSSGLHQGNRGSGDPSISADGRYVAFASAANNLVIEDTNDCADIFVRDAHTGIITLISVDSAGVQEDDYSVYSSISADGRYVVFESRASNLVSGDANGTTDIFLHDMQTGTTTLLSVDSNGIQGNKWSISPSISEDGRYVTFESNANNLVGGDANSTADIFVRDTQTGTTALISVASDGTQGNSLSGYPTISADGRVVSFISLASNLVSGDTNDTQDVFAVPATLFTLAVSKTGTGSGTVTSNPPGISCGPACHSLFGKNTVITLTAMASAGSTFTGWTGSGCSGTDTCTVTMDANKSISFNLNKNRIYLPQVVRN